MNLTEWNEKLGSYVLKDKETSRDRILKEMQDYSTNDLINVLGILEYQCEKVICAIKHKSESNIDVCIDKLSTVQYTEHERFWEGMK